jgi:hypothetical protein
MHRIAHWVFERDTTVNEAHRLCGAFYGSELLDIIGLETAAVSVIYVIKQSLVFTAGSALLWRCVQKVNTNSTSTDAFQAFHRVKNRDTKVCH